MRGLLQRTGGRAVEGARLESVYTFIAYRGFESPSVRQVVKALGSTPLGSTPLTGDLQPVRGLLGRASRTLSVSDRLLDKPQGL